MASRERHVERRLHECRKCGQTYHEERSLNFHLRQRHNIYRGREYPCGQCSYKGSKPYNLARHVKYAHGRSRSPTNKPATLEPVKDLKPLKISLPKSPEQTNTKDGSPAVIDLIPTPDPHLATPPTGKPRGMMQLLADLSDSQSDSEQDHSEGEDHDNDECNLDDNSYPSNNQSDDAPISYVEDTNTDPTLPQPALDAEPSVERVDPTTMTPKNTLPPNKVLVTVVEKKTTRYYAGGLVIRQTDYVETYPAIVPAEWNKHVVCNYGMTK